MNHNFRFLVSLPLSVSLWAVATVQSESANSVTSEAPSITIPSVQAGSKRAITTRDLSALRDIDNLSVSLDGRWYAVLLRQADAAKNTYRTAWFVGAVSGDGTLSYAGDGGKARLMENLAGRRGGAITGNQVRWSPDSTRLAYTASRNGEVQVWTSAVTGGTQRQLTHNAADVRDFAWNEDGRRLIFVVGETRAAIQARDDKGSRDGFLLEEFPYFYEMVHEPRARRPLNPQLTYWTVDRDGTDERLASDAERQEFERMRNFAWGRNQAVGLKIEDLGGMGAPPVMSSTGRPAWLARDSEQEEGILPLLRLHASLNVDGSQPIRCEHAACASQMFSKVWWSEDGKRVIFWRKQGTNLVENRFFAWSPADGALTPIFHEDGDEFRECDRGGAFLICARQTVSRPDHVISIDIRSGALNILADVNAEFRNLELGRMERFEWDAPQDKYDFGYPQRMFGFVIYPPGFDPKRRYPVFIAPYGAPGFRRGDVGDEHPLFVYAANDFIVISSQFPMPVDSYRYGAGISQSELYSVERGFPHLTMNMESTWNALDAIAARGFVDSKRIGIGGLSHGSFVPLYMLQRYDRLSAVAIAGPGWSQYDYYSATRTGRMLVPSDWPEAREFWSQLDIADHVEEVEAPLLVNYADREFFADWRLPRSMENAHRAYEAHIFPDEYHGKWQPAHRYAIYNRNLDWFRFWLQDIEDPDAEKADQYERWRALRELQCRNPRSVRSYCGVESKKIPPAR